MAVPKQCAGSQENDQPHRTRTVLNQLNQMSPRMTQKSTQLSRSTQAHTLLATAKKINRRQKRLRRSGSRNMLLPQLMITFLFCLNCAAAAVVVPEMLGRSQADSHTAFHYKWKASGQAPYLSRYNLRRPQQERTGDHWADNALHISPEPSATSHDKESLSPQREDKEIEASSQATPEVKVRASSPSTPSRVITIPMSAIPPRLHVAGSTKGIPPRIRLLDLGNSNHPVGWLNTFRRILLPNPKPILRTQSVDLYGGIVGVGEYYTVIELGGRKVRVQVDTGSSTLAVPMRGCSSCIPKLNQYDIDKSPSAAPLPCNSTKCVASKCSSGCQLCSTKGSCCSAERPSQCGFALRYADGSSASGALVNDVLKWGELSTRVTFGGILDNSPNFERPEVDGILGMAFPSLACNPSCFDPPFDAMVKGGLVRDVFSICMTATSGKLMLGGYTPSVAKTPVRYVPLYQTDPARYYRVRLAGSLQLGDEQVRLPNFQSAIVDTGTTLIVMSTLTFNKLREQFQRRYCDVPELCGQDTWFQSGMCVSLSAEDLQRLPTLTFNLDNGVNLSLAPEDYMLEYRRGLKKYRCVGIMGMDGLGGMVVLGNTLMQKYVTVYDRTNSRVGFAEAAPNCELGLHS